MISMEESSNEVEITKHNSASIQMNIRSLYLQTALELCVSVRRRDVLQNFSLLAYLLPGA